MQSFSASVEILTNDDNDVTGAEVTVTGHNLSEELIGLLAKHATAVEMGIDTEDLDRRVSDWDVREGTAESLVFITF